MGNFRDDVFGKTEEDGIVAPVSWLRLSQDTFRWARRQWERIYLIIHFVVPMATSDDLRAPPPSHSSTDQTVDETCAG